ncbi:MAG: alpha/beta hydrolase [Sphingorhabdus sp.]
MTDTEHDLRWRKIPEAATESWWQAEDDWKIRRIDWPSLAESRKQRGSLLFLPGRGDHYEKYLETLQGWAEDGWLVTSIDWRGQGLSGRLLEDRHTGHIDDFSTWIADLRFFWERWKSENPGPHVLVAHSMGGHLAMRALVEGAVDPEATILSAPMLGMRTNGLPASWSHAFARWMVRRGKGEERGWKEGEKPMSPMSLRRKILTHSKRRYEDEMFWWKNRPDVRLGPPTWHWLERAFASTRMLNEPGRLESVASPVLMLATKVDQLVSTKRINKDNLRLPTSEVVSFGIDAAHELLREADSVRDQCLSATDAFLDKYAPAK